MADNGGPRVHRPRAPIMSAPAPLTAPLAPLRPQPPVSLVTPRPQNERATNEYVETPFRASQPVPPPPPPPTHSRPTRPARLALPLPPPPVTKQPAAASFSKEQPECAARPSIVCPDCSRCRCESCQQPRPLPKRWVCNDGCLLSADTIVDYASCLCCVKAMFYHCSEPEGGESCADAPCGCGADRRAARWGCLAALSLVLPCLWLYWPLRGCRIAAESCYARHSRTGCRCQRRPALAPTPEKRLLDADF